MIYALIGFAVIVAICVPVCLLEIGYQAGVRETERRWSEAVARKEANAQAKD